MRKSILLACLLAAMFINHSIYAADIGECGTPEAMTEKLKAEGQRSFASADRVQRENNINALNAMFFTMNDDRSVGYIVESDKDSSTRANKICIYQRLSEIRLFDARKPGVPPASLLKATDAEADKNCQELINAGKLETGTCGGLNKTLRVSEKKRERVMFQGFNVEKQPDGSYRKNGALTTVTATLSSSFPVTEKRPVFMDLLSGIFVSSLPHGATSISVILVFSEYTSYGLTLLQ